LSTIKLIDCLVEQGCKGILISATALGHVPTGEQNSVLPNIKKAIDTNLVAKKKIMA